MSIKTPEQIKAEFARQGITTTGWARDHGFPPREVILVLNGYYKCNYGRAHKIAVALGLKPTPESDPEPELAAA
jgi:gp16 family phage-associated protein